jgi:hypothetical protein
MRLPGVIPYEQMANVERRMVRAVLKAGKRGQMLDGPAIERAGRTSANAAADYLLALCVDEVLTPVRRAGQGDLYAFKSREEEELASDAVFAWDREPARAALRAPGPRLRLSPLGAV